MPISSRVTIELTQEGRIADDQVESAVGTADLLDHSAPIDAFVTQVSPRILLGLTATPERSDGKPILGYFNNRPDGAPAVELRLWHALEQQLLCPFEYYACDDDTDFSSVPWAQAGEVAALDKLVTGNHIRARLVLNEWRRLAGDPARGRALVFCVSVAHARFMAAQLDRAGIKAACVVGDTPSDERRQALGFRAAIGGSDGLAQFTLRADRRGEIGEGFLHGKTYETRGSVGNQRMKVIDGSSQSGTSWNSGAWWSRMLGSPRADRSALMLQAATSALMPSGL